ncbi:MAG: hypothetical protein GYB36_02090 [Alphaproteobacteria bacterium]|nr:hypothetical protein [Alphaproteobacteria bacterium]
MPDLRVILIIAACLRVLYGCRPLLAGQLHRLGYPGTLGYEPFVTASIADRSALDLTFGLFILLGYILIVLAAWGQRGWLLAVALCVFLVDQAVWVARSFDHRYNADHAVAANQSFLGPDLIDWALFGLEAAIFAAAVYLGLRYSGLYK